MPLYAFACERCGERFEELQRADMPPPPCPACGSTSARRVLSPFTAPVRRQLSHFTPAATRQDSIGGRHHRH